MTYQHVTPLDHDAACRRGLDGASRHYGLDRERCERCRNLWQRLSDVAERRDAERQRAAQ